jgi:heme/copper-type cytochrome/quinol oxidase subunit 2
VLQTLDGQALGEARVVAKRKLLKLLWVYFMALAVLFLALIGYLAYLHYHDVLYKFLSYWLTIVGSSLTIIESSRDIIKITRNPNIARQRETTSAAKRLVTLLFAIWLFMIIIMGIVILEFLGGLICYGNISKPIYDLMFATALIAYVMATTYGTWWGEKRHM